MTANMRYVITNLNSDHTLRVLTFSAQGQYTYETHEAAEEVMRLFQPSLRQKVLGDRADTLRVLTVECWPGHNDPKCTVWDPGVQS